MCTHTHAHWWTVKIKISFCLLIFSQFFSPISLFVVCMCLFVCLKLCLSLCFHLSPSPCLPVLSYPSFYPFNILPIRPVLYQCRSHLKFSFIPLYVSSSFFYLPFRHGFSLLFPINLSCLSSPPFLTFANKFSPFPKFTLASSVPFIRTTKIFLAFIVLLTRGSLYYYKTDALLFCLIIIQDLNIYVISVIEALYVVFSVLLLH